MTLISCGGLFLVAMAIGYGINWIFSPSFRQTETEDLARTGATFHAAAWAGALLIGFCVLLFIVVAFGALFPNAAQLLTDP